MSHSPLIFVSGAAGFIGSHLVERLVLSGFRVRAFISYRSNSSKGWLAQLSSNVLENVEIIRGDIRNFHSVRDGMVGCEGVFNLAALISIPYSYVNPESYIDVNVKGALNIFQAALEVGVSKVIQTSTSEVYGSALYVPIPETHPLQGQSPYSASKISADQLAHAFHASYRLPVLVLRPFNTFGPRQSSRAIIPTIISQLAHGATELRLGNCNTTRDFTFIEDTVDGFLAAYRSKLKGAEVINLGTGYEIEVSRLAEIISDEMRVASKIVVEATRLRPSGSEVDRLCSDNSKAKVLLDWNPRYVGENGLRRGLAKTISWFNEKKNLEEYDPKTYAI